MQLKRNIGYEELLTLVKQLPANKIEQLKSELNTVQLKIKSKKEITAFQEFLLKGPVMTNKQFEQFTENRKSFNKWRAK